MEVTTVRGLLMLSQLLKPMPSLRPLPLPTMEDGDTEATTARGLLMPHPTMEAGDGVDIMARDPPRLIPTTDGVDTMARDPPRLSPTTDGVDIMARGPPKPSLTTDGVDTEDTMARGLLRPS